MRAPGIGVSPSSVNCEFCFEEAVELAYRSLCCLSLVAHETFKRGTAERELFHRGCVTLLLI